MTALKLFFDGGCRPNPGPIEVAVVARGRTYLRTGLGEGSNDDAEWLALLYALDVARDLGATDLVLVGDSTLVVRQASRDWPCRSPNFKRHFENFRVGAAAFVRRAEAGEIGRAHV